MRLNAFTDFGLRVLTRLAGAPEQSVSTGDLAREFAVSQHHLNKVVTSLSRAGYIVTRRGRGGGIRLARPATDIRIGNVVRDLEAGVALVECFRADGGKCTLAPHCRLIAPLREARARFLEELNRTTLQDCAFRPSGPAGASGGAPGDA